jgi:S-adenosylmethionine-diacylglycerol 3-amino-3-carboxypropyl transferase
LHWFDPKRGGFYFQGLAGKVARAFHTYLKVRPSLAESVSALFGAQSLEEQRAIYDQRIGPRIWSPGVNWALSRQITMSMLGVPHAQRKQVQAQHQRGVAGFIREALEYVFRELPVWTNYFYSVYVNGRYSPHLLSGVPEAGKLPQSQGRVRRPGGPTHLHRHPVSCRGPRSGSRSSCFSITWTG